MTEEFNKRGRIRKKTRKKLNLFFREARRNPKQIEAVLNALAGQKISIELLAEAGIEIETSEEIKLIEDSTDEIITIDPDKEKEELEKEEKPELIDKNHRMDSILSDEEAWEAMEAGNLFGARLKKIREKKMNKD